MVYFLSVALIDIVLLHIGAGLI